MLVGLRPCDCVCLLEFHTVYCVLQGHCGVKDWLVGILLVDLDSKIELRVSQRLHVEWSEKLPCDRWYQSSLRLAAKC